MIGSGQRTWPEVRERWGMRCSGPFFLHGRGRAYATHSSSPCVGLGGGALPPAGLFSVAAQPIVPICTIVLPVIDFARVGLGSKRCGGSICFGVAPVGGF